MLTKTNRLLRRIVVPLNIINLLVGVFMGIGYVCIPLPTLSGLILGIILAMGSTTSIAIGYYFTYKKTTDAFPVPETTNTREANVFMFIAVPAFLLNSAAVFFGMYTGTLLIASALAIPLAAPIIAGTAIFLASLLATGTLINSWLQTHYLWEALKKPVITQTVTIPSAPQPSPIAEKIRRHSSPTKLWLPPRGVAKIDSTCNNDAYFRPGHK